MHTLIHRLYPSPLVVPAVYRFCKLGRKTLFAFCAPKVNMRGWVSWVWTRWGQHSMSSESDTKSSSATGLSPYHTSANLTGSVHSTHTKNTSFHLPLVVLSHAESFCFTSQDCGAQIMENWAWKAGQQCVCVHVFFLPETVSPLLRIFHRLHCQQYFRGNISSIKSSSS